MKYTGSCHCGNVKFEVEGEIQGVISCNCSMCARRGSLLWFVPRDKLRVTGGEKNLATYTFNKHHIKHRFCPKCGIHTHGEGVDPKGNSMGAINIRCLEGTDLNAVKVTPFDGRSL
jgi:hypothetical protein